ncbi:MAG: 50S ribosomal protein L21 [Janthinobacterium lividum]
MFAVIKTGGKQYKVSPGTLLKVERLEGEAGQSIHLSSVLLLNNEGTITVGAPLLDQIQVSATILEQARADKIIVFKKKRRQGYRRKAGHRQDITILRIEEILTAGKAHTDRKTQETKALPQATNQSSEATNFPLEAKASAAKKPKVKKEVESSSADMTSHGVNHIEPVATEMGAPESVKKPTKKASSPVSTNTDDGKEISTVKEKKKPSSKSSDSDSSDSQ